MTDVSSIIEVQALLKSKITPQRALQLLASCPSANIFINIDIEPIWIFLAFLGFIMRSRPDGLLVGIWDELLCKTIKYSKNFFYRRDMIDDEDHGVDFWLAKVLFSSSKCPNSYTRLELFRLARIFRLKSELSLVNVCNTFIHTISNIQPLRLYPSGNEDDMLFGAIDLKYIVTEGKAVKILRDIIAIDIKIQLQKTNAIVVKSDETRFLLHCIQLVRIFSAIARYTPDPRMGTEVLQNCTIAMLDGIYKLVKCKGYTMRDIMSHEPFHHYIVEFVRDLTEAEIIFNQTDLMYHIMLSRDLLVADLHICSQTSKLPKLLLERQIYASRGVKRHSLLLSNLSAPFTEEDSNRRDLESNLSIDELVMSNENQNLFLDGYSDSSSYDYNSDTYSSNDQSSYMDTESSSDEVNNVM